MQDGASSHTSRISRDRNYNKFGARVINIRTNSEWSPHSLDLNPLDFFYVFLRLYTLYFTKTATVQELRTLGDTPARGFDQAMCERIIANVERRVNLYHE